MNNNNQEFYIDREEGYFIAIVGSSGCGKSTLLSIICDLENKTDGEIIFYKDNSIIGYMLQEDALFNHLTIYENIILGLKILGIDNEDNINYAMEILDKYGLIKFKDKFEYKQDETLSTEEASIYLNITRQTLHNYVKQGKLHPKKQLGGTLQFYKRELDNLIK